MKRSMEASLIPLVCCYAYIPHSKNDTASNKWYFLFVELRFFLTPCQISHWCEDPTRNQKSLLRQLYKKPSSTQIIFSPNWPHHNSKHTYTSTNTHIQTQTHTYKHKHTHTNTNTHIQTQTHTYKHKHTHTNTNTQIQTQTHTYKDTPQVWIKIRLYTLLLYTHYEFAASNSMAVSCGSPNDTPAQQRW
jgi:hypothetical protein